MKIIRWGSVEFSPNGREVTVRDFTFDAEGAPLHEAAVDALRQIADQIVASGETVESSDDIDVTESELHYLPVQ